MEIRETEKEIKLYEAITKSFGSNQHDNEGKKVHDCQIIFETSKTDTTEEQESIYIKQQLATEGVRENDVQQQNGDRQNNST